MAGTASPRAQVIVVAYNSGRHLQRCIDALEAQSFTDFEAVVWDNGSTDGAIATLRTGTNTKVVLGGDNIGFAAANNRAAARARSPYIVLLNPDAFPEPDWLATLVAAADETGAEAVTSLQLEDADPTRLDGAGDCMSICGFPWRGGFDGPASQAPRERCEVFSGCGAAVLYRREVFEALGGFEERFFCYCEDVDLGFRIRRMGGRCVLEPRAVVRHVGGGSSGQVSNFAEYHGARNRLWTLARNMPLALAPIAIPAHILVLAYVLARSPALLPVRLRALRDALAQPDAFRRARVPGRERLWPLVQALSWSPLALSRRAVVTRPMRP